MNDKSLYERALDLVSAGFAIYAMSLLAGAWCFLLMTGTRDRIPALISLSAWMGLSCLCAWGLATGRAWIRLVAMVVVLMMILSPHGNLLRILLCMLAGTILILPGSKAALESRRSDGCHEPETAEDPRPQPFHAVFRWASLISLGCGVLAAWATLCYHPSEFPMGLDPLLLLRGLAAMGWGLGALAGIGTGLMARSQEGRPVPWELPLQGLNLVTVVGALVILTSNSNHVANAGFHPGTPGPMRFSVQPAFQLATQAHAQTFTQFYYKKDDPETILILAGPEQGGPQQVHLPTGKVTPMALPPLPQDPQGREAAWAKALEPFQKAAPILAERSPRAPAPTGSPIQVEYHPQPLPFALEPWEQKGAARLGPPSALTWRRRDPAVDDLALVVQGRTVMRRRMEYPEHVTGVWCQEALECGLLFFTERPGLNQDRPTLWTVLKVPPMPSWRTIPHTEDLASSGTRPATATPLAAYTHLTGVFGVGTYRDASFSEGWREGPPDFELEVGIEASQAGNYFVTANLQDRDNQAICQINGGVDTPSGPATITCRVAVTGNPLLSHADGPYYVSNLQVQYLNRNGGVPYGKWEFVCTEAATLAITGFQATDFRSLPKIPPEGGSWSQAQWVAKRHLRVKPGRVAVMKSPKAD